MAQRYEGAWQEGEEGETYQHGLRGFTSFERPKESDYVVRSSYPHGTQAVTIGQSIWGREAIDWFIAAKGVFPMPEPSYVKGIFDEIAVVRKEQNQKFDSIEKGVEEVKADLKELRHEFKEDLTNGIKDLKDSVIFRLDAFEKSVDTRFDSQGKISAVLGSGIGANLLASLFALWKLLSK